MILYDLPVAMLRLSFKLLCEGISSPLKLSANLFNLWHFATVPSSEQEERRKDGD